MEGRLEVTSWLERLESCCLMGTEFLLGGWEGFHGGDGCTAVWMWLMWMNYVPKKGKVANFMPCILCHTDMHTTLDGLSTPASVLLVTKLVLLRIHFVFPNISACWNPISFSSPTLNAISFLDDFPNLLSLQSNQCDV